LIHGSLSQQLAKKMQTRLLKSKFKKNAGIKTIFSVFNHKNQNF